SSKQFSISLSKPARVEELRLSRRGDKLAWKLRYTDWEYEHGRLEEIKWNLGMVPSSRIVLMVSNLDGSGMKELGYSETPANKLGPWDIHWTPDGRRISFWNNQILYVVPAE